MDGLYLLPTEGTCVTFPPRTEVGREAGFPTVQAD